MSHGFTVTVTEPTRAAEWSEILGTTTLRIRDPRPSRADLPGYPDIPVYLLDLESLTPDQLEKLTWHLAFKFDVPYDQVLHTLRSKGIPIMCEHCMVGVPIRVTRP